MQKLLLMFLFFSLSAQAQFSSDIEEDDSKYRESNYIKEYIPETPQTFDITGNKRMTFAYYSGLTPSDFGTISDLEAQFGYNMGKYWLEAVIGQGKAQFGSVAENSSSRATSDSEGNFIRDDELEESYLYLGIGASLRSHHLSDLLGFDRIYESFTGYATYHTLSEELRQQDYAGFGARADAAINYLLSDNSQLGLRFSFGISALKRAEAYQGEVSAERSMTFRWNRIGADYSFFF